MQKRHRPSFFAALFERIGRGSRPASKTPKKAPAKTATAAPRPFQAIGIYHGTVCCAAAKKAEGYRFLAKQAPPIPLTECTMRSKCECRYMKFHDRRGSPRRLTEFGLRETLFAAAERRNRRGRRAKD
jgi:hypothetical protein